MPNRRPTGQKNFQCEFCPTRNSWVRLIMVVDQRRFICPECIAELAKQIRKEKNAAVNPNRGIGDNTTQTETPSIKN